VEENILRLIYPEQEIFIKDFKFPCEELSISTTCLVPSKTHYVLRPVPYVTTENYVRCLSQASYLLSHHIIKNGLIPLEIPETAFIQAAMNYELYYRNLAMTFHKRVTKDEEFIMKLVLKNFREIKSLQDFILFVFSNTRTVISGEMSFVFKSGSKTNGGRQ